MNIIPTVPHNQDILGCLIIKIWRVPFMNTIPTVPCCEDMLCTKHEVCELHYLSGG